MTEPLKDTIAKANTLLDPRAVLEYLAYRPDTIQEGEKVIRCFCPVHKEQVVRSLTVEKDTNKCKCQYAPCPARKPVDLIGLVALAKQVREEDALVELVQHFKLNVEVPGMEVLLKSRLEAALAQLEQGNLDGALTGFAHVLSLQADNFPALEGTADILARQGKAAEQAAVLKRIIGIRLRAGEHQEAATCLEEYLQNNPADVEMHLRLAECCHHLGQQDAMIAQMVLVAKLFEDAKETDKALEIYHRIDTIKPGANGVKGAVIDLLVKVGRAEEAIEQIVARVRHQVKTGAQKDALVGYEQILEIAPTRDEFRMEYLQAILSVPAVSESEEAPLVSRCLDIVAGFTPDGMDAFATQALQQLHRHYPTNVSILEKLLEATNGPEMVEEAAALQEKLSDTYTVRANRELAANALDQALADYARAAELLPDNTEAVAGMLHVSEKQKNLDQIPLLQKRLAGLYAARKEYEEAIPLLEKYLKTCSEDMDTRMLFVECLHSLGRGGEMLNELKSVAQAFAKGGETARAIEIYEKISSIDPEDQDVHEELIGLLVKNGRSDDAADHISAQADHYRSDGRIQEALTCYRQILDLNPERDDIRLKYVQTLVTAPNLKPADLQECLLLMDGFVQDEWSNMALQILEDLRSRFPGNIGILEKIHAIYLSKDRQQDADALAFDIAQNLQETGHYKEALEWIEPLIKREGAVRPIALSLKGDICKSNGDKVGAIAAYHEIITDYEARGEFEDSLLIYESILEVDPDNLEYLMRRVGTMLTLNMLDDLAALADDVLPILKRSDDPSEALQIFQKIMSAIPPDPELLLGEAALLTHAKRDREARQAMLRATDLFSSQENETRAIEILEQLMQIDPNDLAVIEKLADCRLNAGQNKQAVEAYRTLAELYGEQGSVDAQLDVLLKISEAQPDDTETLTSILTLYDQMENTRDAKELREKLVRVYLARKKYPEALQLCEEAIKANPTDIFLLESAYRIHEALGNPNGNDQRKAGLNLFVAYRTAQENDKAVRLIDQLETKYPSDPEVLESRLFVLADVANWNPALEVLDRLLTSLNKKQEYEKGLHVLRGLITHVGAPAERLANTWISLCRATGAFRENWKETEQLVTALEKTQKTTQAAELLHEFIDEAPGFEPARERYIQILETVGLHAKAVDALCDWAGISIDDQNHSEANRYYNLALEIAPDDIDLLNQVLEFRAHVGIREGASDIALRIAEQLESEGLIAKAAAALEMGLKAEPARNDLRIRLLEFEDLASDSTRLKLRYIETADSQFEEQQFSKSHATLLEAIRRFPADLTFRHKLINVLKALNLKDEYLVEMANIAAVQSEMGNLSAALQTIGEVLEIEHNNLRAQALQTEIKEKLGQDTAAFEEFRKILKAVPGATPDKILEMLTSGGSIGSGQQILSQESLEMLPLLKNYNFETFIVGSRNNFAYATAMAVAKTPGSDYNPLFLYGDVGLGKTHLLHAIANAIVARNPDTRVLYTSSEEFTNALIEAIQNNTIRQFRTLHKSPDVFLIDDIHGLAEKERAQEEFFQIFNTLYQSNKQIVMTSDRPPKDIAHLERRLRSRFGAGIIVDMQSPDLETRVAILRNHIALTGEIIEDEILNLIAQTVESNIRELLSALTQIVARIRLTHEKPTPQIVRQIVEHVREL